MELSDVTQKKKSRSRNGCHRCKKLKIKCDETKPACGACTKSEKDCDYTVKLTWGGRPFKNKKEDNLAFGTIVTFEKKYNPEEHERKKRKVLKGSDTSSPESIVSGTRSSAMEKNHSISSITSNFTVNSAKSSSSLQSPNVESPPSISSPKINALDEEEAPRTQSSADIAPPSPNTILNQSMVSFQEEFQNLETTNPVIKQFVNEVVLPDLSANMAFSGDVAMSDPKVPRFEISEDSESKEEALDQLVISERFLSYSPPSNSLLAYDQFGQNIREFTGFEFLLPEISPLPDMLLTNPYYKKHYNAYIDNFSKLLCPASPESYPENPFSCILPRMSLTAGTEGLLSVLLASSISASASMKKEPYPQEIVKQLLTSGLNDLYKRLTDETEAKSDYTLALVLLLSDFELICGRKNSGWRAHFHGARKIMFAKGMLNYRDYSSKNIRTIILEPGDESDIKFFFVRWLAFLDIIGALSSNSSLAALSYKENKTKWRGKKPTFEIRERFKDIDPLMGFDIYFCEFFCEISSLVQEREYLFPDKKTVSPSLVQSALELKDKMVRYLEESEKERDQIYQEYLIVKPSERNCKIEDYEVLRATNKAFVLAGVMQIYRRVLLLERSSPIVQEVVTTMTELLRVDIPQTTTAAYCTTLSVLSAGSEAIEISQREFYMKRLKEVGTWVVFANVAHDVMLESWKTGDYWADILAARGLDYIFV